MGVNENKELVRRLYEEIVSHGDLDDCDEFVAKDVIEHEAVPGGAAGLQGFKDTISGFRASFPDIRFQVLDLIGEDDKVVVRLKVTGSQQNDFLGIKATGNPVSFESIDIIRFEDGMIVEHWGCSDNLGFMQQIDAVPTTEALVAGQ